MLSITNLNAWYGKSHVVRDLSVRSAGTPRGRHSRSQRRWKDNDDPGDHGNRTPAPKGRIALDGREIQALPADRIARAGVAYVPQGRQLFPHLTVRENLQLAWHGDRFGDAEVNRGIAHFPPLGRLLERHAGNLSGGEQQMVAIGRALLNSPRAVLLDEPTEGLAPLFVNTVREVITKLREEGVAVLLVEQNLHMALSVCQYVYFMEKGTIAHECPVEEARTGAVVERFLGVRIK